MSRLTHSKEATTQEEKIKIMNSLKQNLIHQRKEAVRKEFKETKNILRNLEKIKFRFFLLTSVIAYLTAITVLYEKEKIT